MKHQAQWEGALYELIRRTSVDLPDDVEAALRRAWSREQRHSRAREVLGTILDNIERARRNDAPICQDTGALTFYVRVPVGFDTNALAAVARGAVARATRLGYLRQNTVDAVSGDPYQTNVAYGAPVFRFEQGARSTVDVRLLLKGGGSENVSRQYSLPDAALHAGRNLDGVRRCVLDAIVQAQGNGCAPGVLGVCLGGDRVTGAEHAKEQFLRRLDDHSRLRVLARLEERLFEESRALQIGPMGLGGESTLLGVKIGALSRLPASFFVTVAYMCWAFRRRGMVLATNGRVQRWLY